MGYEECTMVGRWVSLLYTLVGRALEGPSSRETIPVLWEKWARKRLKPHRSLGEMSQKEASFSPFFGRNGHNEAHTASLGRWEGYPPWYICLPSLPGRCAPARLPVPHCTVGRHCHAPSSSVTLLVPGLKKRGILRCKEGLSHLKNKPFPARKGARKAEKPATESHSVQGS